MYKNHKNNDQSANVESIANVTGNAVTAEKNLSTSNTNKNKITPIPTRWVGPIKISGSEFNLLQEVPLATFEKPLWSAVSRGARVTRACAGLNISIAHECMTRSILVETQNAAYLVTVIHDLPQYRETLQQIVASTSAFTMLQDWQTQIIGNLLYIRFSFTVGDAAGHNMATKAADALLRWLLQHYSYLHYVSVSGNFCVDKKVSVVNGVLGRGKYVIADMLIPYATCITLLNTAPATLIDLHVKKNLLGSIAAGSIRSANAHFANMLLAFYLATGQDAANIVEGSQGIVHATLSPTANKKAPDLYFSVTLPNIIVGTIGSGKTLSFARENLELLGCRDISSQENTRVKNIETNKEEKENYRDTNEHKVERQIEHKHHTGWQARKLAVIAAANVWCGEISLLATQANQGELVRCHEAIERKNKYSLRTNPATKPINTDK